VSIFIRKPTRNRRVTNLFFAMTAKTLMADSLPRIDKNVPLPSARFDGGHPFSILRKLEPGDSVFFRGVISGSNSYKVLSNRLSYLKVTQGFLLTSRSVIEDGAKGVRVWRKGEEDECE